MCCAGWKRSLELCVIQWRASHSDFVHAAFYLLKIPAPATSLKCNPAYQLQVDPQPTSQAGGEKNGTKRSYRQAKETECGETGGKESQCSIVVKKRRHGPSEPRGAKGCRVVDGELEPRRGHGGSPACHRETTSGVRDSDMPQRDEPGASSTRTPGSVGAPGSNPWSDPAPGARSNAVRLGPEFLRAGERPFRTPWSEGGAALWMGSWNHAEDAVPHQRVTAKRPGRVRGQAEAPQRPPRHGHGHPFLLRARPSVCVKFLPQHQACGVSASGAIRESA